MCAGIAQIDNVSPTLPGVVLSTDDAHYTDVWVLKTQQTIVLHQLAQVLLRPRGAACTQADGVGRVQG